MARATCRVDRPFTRRTFSPLYWPVLTVPRVPIHLISGKKLSKTTATFFYQLFFTRLSSRLAYVLYLMIER